MHICNGKIFFFRENENVTCSNLATEVNDKDLLNTNLSDSNDDV